MLTQKELKDKLNYNPVTGIFTWANCKSTRMKNINRAGYNHLGYIQISISSTKYYAHRLAWLWVYGCHPFGHIDHISGNRSDNTIDNLRDVDSHVNAMNRRTPSNNTSGHIGVVWHKGANKWQADIKLKGNKVYLGLFKDKADAISARKAAEKELGFHPNHGRKKGSN